MPRKRPVGTADDPEDVWDPLEEPASSGVAWSWALTRERTSGMGRDGAGDLDVEAGLRPVRARDRRPLSLLLADLAADLELPIDLPMEAAPASMATPSPFLETDLADSPTVQDNTGTLERLLSTGGFARVYIGHQHALRGPVAVKLLGPGSPGEDPDQVRRFLDEARITAPLSHPGIVVASHAIIRCHRGAVEDGGRRAR